MPPETPGLALDTERGSGQGLETLLGDGLATLGAHAVGAGVEPDERGVDLLDGHERLGREHQVALPFDVERVAFARLLVELDVSRFVLGRQLFGLVS